MLLCFIFFYIVLWLEVIIFNVFTLRDRSDLQLSATTILLFPFYRTALMFFRIYALFVNILQYVRSFVHLFVRLFVSCIPVWFWTFTFVSCKLSLPMRHVCLSVGLIAMHARVDFQIHTPQATHHQLARGQHSRSAAVPAYGEPGLVYCVAHEPGPIAARCRQQVGVAGACVAGWCLRRAGW